MTSDGADLAVAAGVAHGGSLPPRAERVAAVRKLMGSANPSVRHLALGIRAITRRSFERNVVPLIEAHWPALRADPFYEKLRIGACDLYASAPYTVLFCAPTPPPLVRAVITAGRLLPLPFAALSLLGRGALGFLGRFALRAEHRRIVLIASLIMLVDQLLDHCLTEPPVERGKLLEAVIQGRTAPSTPGLALVRAIVVAQAEGLAGRERQAYEAAMRRLSRWIEAEVRAMKGEPDPLGLGHHLAGIEGGIDGLLFPVVRYTGESARRWMYDVSMFMQVMDDYLDCEIDAQSGRSTPVMTGEWTFADVEATWRKTVVGLESLLHAAGLTSPRYVQFVVTAYVSMIVEVMEAMALRPAL
jgi:hypothetical protein